MTGKKIGKKEKQDESVGTGREKNRGARRCGYLRADGGPVLAFLHGFVIAAYAKCVRLHVWDNVVLRPDANTALCRYHTIFSQILTIYTPQLAREGEVWGVCCDSNLMYFLPLLSQCRM